MFTKEDTLLRLYSITIRNVSLLVVLNYILFKQYTVPYWTYYLMSGVLLVIMMSVEAYYVSSEKTKRGGGDLTGDDAYTVSFIMLQAVMILFVLAVHTILSLVGVVANACTLIINTVMIYSGMILTHWNNTKGTGYVEME